MLSSFLIDLRFGARTLVRAPSFTLVAVATLALGIGANTAVFSVVDGVLLRPLPYDEPEELVTVWLDMTERGGPAREWMTSEDLLDLRAEPGLFEAIGGWGAWTPTLTELGEPTVLAAARVTEGTFERVLRVQPFLGRGFLPEEDLPGAAGVVLLSHALWTERFGADHSVLGRPIILDETPHSVVGVMPEGFHPPFAPGAALWTPARLDATRCGRGCWSVRAIARLAPGVSLVTARERAGALARRLATAYPETNAQVGVTLHELQEDLAGTAGRALWILLGAVGFVLLIACTNVASLLLSRGTARRGEFAVRIALGAGRGPIFRQLLTESLVLASVGGLLGVLLASWGTDVLVAIAPVTLPGLAEVSVDGRILRFAATLTLGTGVVFGFVPALRAGAQDVRDGLARRRVLAGLTERLRSALVVFQVATAMVLLVGAGLLIRSLARLDTVELGFEPEGVLTVEVSLPTERYPGPERVSFHDVLRERLGGIPGVVAAGATASLPMAGRDGDVDFVVEGLAPPAPPATNVAWLRPITAGYFYTIGQRVLDGRDFDESDVAGAPPTALVNEALVARYFTGTGRPAIGRRIALEAGGEWRTIVGVVADSRHFGVRDEERPAIYLPHAQWPSSAMTVAVRSYGDPLDLAAEVRAAVSALDPRLAASSVAPMEDRVAQAIVTERFATGVLLLFALAALVLAAVGLYGVVSYGVALRLREMGIRLALGAAGDDVRRMVVRRSLGMAVIGAALGAVGALALTGVLERLLYEVPVADPATYATTVGVLAWVALAASWWPARRAARTDPASVLRHE